MPEAAQQARRQQATMILIRGLPGSGKSYIAAALQESLSGPVILLDPDTIDFSSSDYIHHSKTLKEEGVDESLHAYRYLRSQAYKGIAEGGTILWNQPFTNLEIFKKMTTNFYTQAAENGIDLRLLVVEVEVDPELAKKRVEDRKQAGGHGPSHKTFDRFVRDYHSFATDGYATVTVQGSSDVEESVAQILTALGRL
jgi:predicted ABC-type ATPase